MPANLPNTRDEVAATFRESFPEPVVQVLLAQARPGLVLHTVPEPDDAIPLGTSKFGGSPDAPPGFAWPYRPAYGHGDAWAAEQRGWAARGADVVEGREHLVLAELVVQPFPLAFIAQLDLAQLAPSWGFDPLLPREGRLLFFYDYRANPLTHGPEARVGWKLIWDTTPPDQLVRASLPAELGTLNETRFVDDRATARIVADSTICMLPPADFDVDTPSLDDRHDQTFDDAWNLLYEIEQKGGITHQLGGWPTTFQYGLREWSELGRNGLHHDSEATSDRATSDETQPQTEPVKEWQLLLQVALDGPDDLFQNGGAIYVMMRERDMRARAFDQAWVVYQCD